MSAIYPVPLNPFVRNRKLITFSVLVLLVAGSLVLWPRSEPPIVGTLSARDVAAISGIVRAEMWRGVLPNRSWAAIRDLPSSIRRLWSERILSINVLPDGSVEVMTGQEGRRLVWKGVFYGTEYHLKKGSRGWEIIRGSGSFWISSLNERPDLESLEPNPLSVFTPGAGTKSGPSVQARATILGGGRLPYR